jgi:DNA (cytosine-5)-methyltransferase 1
LSIATIPQLLAADDPGGELTWADHFCGAGGSALGIDHVPGMRVKYAINHDDIAVQAHAANHPDTDHECQSIENVHPSRFGRTDCAWFSPSCPAHSYSGSRGADPDSVRSRATMWDVPRWTEYHRYDYVVVENVVEVKLWCDEHPPKVVNGKRVMCSCGSSYDSWWRRMELLGYTGREVYLNSQAALVPQSRDRLYVVWTRSGCQQPDLDLRPPCYCTDCEDVVAGIQTWKAAKSGRRRTTPRLAEWGRYGHRNQYVYTCPHCQQVVAPAVLGSWSIVDDTVPIDPIAGRLVSSTRQRIKTGVVRVGQARRRPVPVGGHLFERPGYARVWSLDDPMRTITTTAYMGIVLRAGGQGISPRALDEGLMTLTAHDRQVGLLTSAGGAKVAARSTSAPAPTVLTYDRLGLVLPNRTNNTGAAPDEPAKTITTAQSDQMVVAMRSGMDGRAVDEPAPAQATRSDVALVGLRNHGTVDCAVSQPARGVTAGGNHHGLLVYNGTPGHVRALGEPAGTIKGRDSQSLLVQARTGVEWKPHDTPLATVTTKAGWAHVEADPWAERWAEREPTDGEIDEFYFRMLRWHELQRGQGMHEHPDGRPYLLEARVRTKRGKYKDISDEQRVKLVGNAVSSPVAAVFCHAIAQAAAGPRTRAPRRDPQLELALGWAA